MNLRCITSVVCDECDAMQKAMVKAAYGEEGNAMDSKRKQLNALPNAQ